MREIDTIQLCNLLGISPIIISRLKGRRTLPHEAKEYYPNIINNKISLSYLSSSSPNLNLDDLKRFIIYTILYEKSIIKTVQKINVLLSTKNIDTLLKDVLYEKRKLLNLSLEDIANDLNLYTAIEILKKLYKKIEITDIYSHEDILNLEKTEFKKVIKEENKESITINKNNYDILGQIFEKYSHFPKGYFPLQHPTGNGKTYYLIQFLVKMLQENFKNLDKERIIVVTNNKVNLNEIYRDIINQLKVLNIEEQKNNILQVKSINDILSDKEFLKEILKELEEDLHFYKLFSVEFIINFKRRLTEVLNILEKEIEINISEYLQEFILALRNKMFDFYENKFEKNIVLPQFFYKLYPMIIDQNSLKKLFIMTTDKFLYGYTGKTQTEYFYEKYKNSLIFIDEVDSAKERFLNFTRNQRTLTIKNITNVFNERFNSFSKKENNQLPNLIQRVTNNDDSNKEIITQQKINRKKKNLMDHLSRFKQKGEKLRKKYFTTKRYFELENNRRIDLFEENNHFLMENNKKLYIEITDKNCLITEKETPIELTTMLTDLFDYIYNDFYELIHKIYEFHISLKEDNEIEREIISHFFYNSDIQKEILNEYKNFYIPLLKIKGKSEISFSNKCSYIQIYEENPEYSTNKKILIGYQHMYLTPEDLFYYICSRNFVFGISATAEIETCIGNFDIKWLKNKLKDSYFKLNDIEKTQLNSSLSSINSFEKNIIRSLNIFENEGLYGNYKENNFINLNTFLKKNGSLQKGIINIWKSYSDKLLTLSLQEYQLNYFDYATCTILNFLFDKNTNSLLFLSNRLTYKDILKEMITEMANYLNKNIFFQSLSAKELDEKLNNKDNDLIKNLENHKIKTIIFTTYQSAGVGVNIKHQFSKNLNRKLIKIDKKVQNEINFPLIYKDIDEIALEHKTNLIKFDNFSSDKICLLYYCNLLLRNKAINNFKRLLLLNRENDFILKLIYMNTQDYVENAAGKIIQGIGRCNRTKVRNKVRNIYLDKEAYRVIKKFDPKDRLFIEDFNFLIDYSTKDLIPIKDEEKENVKKIIMKNYDVKKYFEVTFLSEITRYNNIMREQTPNNLKEDHMENFLKLYNKYQNFRSYILKNPTQNSSKENISYFSIGKELNRYFAHFEGNDELTDIYFLPNEGNISKEECRLDKISAIPLLKEFCKKNIGNFKKNKEILLPYPYQAIFKGMLGETIIKEIFSIYGIELKNSEEMIKLGIVEIFDDISKNGMFIDYKNYNLDKISYREFINENIEEKLVYKQKLINNKNKLFIINLIDKIIHGNNPSIYLYQLDKILNKSLETCTYEESEVVIISGILRFKDDKKTLEINEVILKNLKEMLANNYE